MIWKLVWSLFIMIFYLFIPYWFNISFTFLYFIIYILSKTLNLYFWLLSKLFCFLKLFSLLEYFFTFSPNFLFLISIYLLLSFMFFHPWISSIFPLFSPSCFPSCFPSIFPLFLPLLPSFFYFVTLIPFYVNTYLQLLMYVHW